MRTSILGAGAALALAFLTGCTFNMTTTRHEIATGAPAGKEVSVHLSDANLGGGEQAYVNASVVAQLKSNNAGVTLVAAGEDLSIDVQLLPAYFISRWYTGLTLGKLRLYYQLGSVRVVDRGTGKILAVHEIVLSGRRTRTLGLVDYQTLVLPMITKLVAEEMTTQGIARAPLSVDVSEPLASLD